MTEHAQRYLQLAFGFYVKDPHADIARNHGILLHFGLPRTLPW